MPGRERPFVVLQTCSTLISVRRGTFEADLLFFSDLLSDLLLRSPVSNILRDPLVHRWWSALCLGTTCGRSFSLWNTNNDILYLVKIGCPHTGQLRMKIRTLLLMLYFFRTLTPNSCALDSSNKLASLTQTVTMYLGEALRGAAH